jgi:hypothetical protein
MIAIRNGATTIAVVPVTTIPAATYFCDEPAAFRLSEVGRDLRGRLRSN